ncbi:hypothetical protein S40293_11482 [Stachybotrys chartarum IBT 40293]|nr:hypothetical protein S40293_11482 [Stachybotrys chartarum IBT 40293]
MYNPAFLFFLIALYSGLLSGASGAPAPAPSESPENPFSDPANGSPENPFTDPATPESDSHSVQSWERWTNSFPGSDTSDPNPLGPKAPGFGVEFESSAVLFQYIENSQGTYDGYNNRKGTPIDGGIGFNNKWMFTGDTTMNDWDGRRGSLTGEFIISGKDVMLGAGMAALAAREMTAHWKEKKYWTKSGQTVQIVGDPQNPSPEMDDWSVLVAPENPLWGAQVTVAMPLAAIDHLFELSKTFGSSHKLLSAHGLKRSRMVWVSEAFFENFPATFPEGNRLDKTDKELRGFLSLLLSYAKNAHATRPNESAKTLTPIMPRTSLNSVYEKINEKLNGADLLKVLEHLACYKWVEVAEGDSTKFMVELDSDWCDGLTPKENWMRTQEFKTDPEDPLTVEDWLRNMSNGCTDLLAMADVVDVGQIGAFGDKFEWVFATQEEAPLFEFRDLHGPFTESFESWVVEAEEAILELHEIYKRG